MTNDDYGKAMKKIETELYDNTVKTMKLENQIANAGINQRNIQMRKLALDKDFIKHRESTPDLSIR